MSLAPFLAPNRDNPAKVGRGKASGGTIYYTIGMPATIGTINTTLSANRDYYEPIQTPAPMVVDQLICEFGTAAAGNNVRLGIYVADTDWQPVGPPLADSGDISLTTPGIMTYTPGTPLYLNRGRYVKVINYSGGTPAFKGYRCSMVMLPTTLAAETLNQFYVGRAYAAFPTPGTAWSTIVSSSTVGHYHSVTLRVSAP